MLAVRLILELAALTAFGVLGWRAFDSPWKYALVVILPIAGATLWGTFAVPDDPSRSGNAPIPVDGRVRLLVEMVVLFGGALALWAADLPRWALAFAAILVAYHAVAYDRIHWLISSGGTR
ncbi:YrdB family protein [Nocardia cyriacigeorgica]|uniref:YrdB family protein n=2 Tax=Nocardia cyriacigeorgica TaxID=135487 RepID=A0A6P1CZ61_9NOCA|nr:YrdB family protein [Nocardia cyriacigeorgica]NEW43425.1 YrdB family protein [Nocardia cyriacigeorgica]NEW51504.1 YrdB family protein [Nocardia cyriacigeorgica]NEW56555.1 YrdB family protein [Nocardia cyriacigeorgica]